MPSDLTGVLKLLRRYWLLLFGGGLAGMLALLVVSVVVIGPGYQVMAKVLLSLGPEMALSPLLSAREATNATPMTRRPEDPATGVEIFSDPRLVRAVIAGLGEDFFADAPPATPLQHIKATAKWAIRAAGDAWRETLVAAGLRPRTTLADRVALAVSAALRIEPVRRSDIITITLSFPDPRAGEHILERFIALALSRYLQAHRSPGVAGFFGDGRAARRAELREAEDRLLAYRLANEDPVWSVAEQRPVLIRAEAESQSQLRQVRTAIAAAEAEVARAEAALALLPPEIEISTVRSRNATMAAMRSRLVELRLELGTQGARYGEGSQEIADIRRQIDALQGQVAAEMPFVVDQMTMGVNPMHQSVARDLLAKRIEIEGQRGSAARLEGNIQELRRQLQRIETAAVGIAELEREVALLRRAVELYDRGFEEARLTEAIEAVQLSGLRVVMPPTAEVLPSSPSLRRTLLLGFAGGFALVVLFILLREFRNRPGPGEIVA